MGKIILIVYYNVLQKTKLVYKVQSFVWACRCDFYHAFFKLSYMRAGSGFMGSSCLWLLQERYFW